MSEKSTVRRSAALNTEREVRRAEEEADGLVALAARQLEGGADAVHRDEAELPHRRRIARAGDEHPAEASERRLAGVPVAEREQRVHGVVSSVICYRALIRRRVSLRIREHPRI